MRAALLVRLLTLPDEHQAIKLAGARIAGPLDLEGAILGRWLVLSDCWLEGPVNLSHATAPVVRLPGCHLPGLVAENLRTSGDLALDHGFTARGEVNLAHAQTRQHTRTTVGAGSFRMSKQQVEHAFGEP